RRSDLPRPRREVIGLLHLAWSSLLRLPFSDESGRCDADYSIKKYFLRIAVHELYLRLPEWRKAFPFFPSQFRTFPSTRRISEAHRRCGVRRNQLVVCDSATARRRCVHGKEMSRAINIATEELSERRHSNDKKNSHLPLNYF